MRLCTAAIVRIVPLLEVGPMSKRLLEGDALMRRAADLGVSAASGEMISVAGKGMASIPAHEHETQRRVLEAERHLREHRLWIGALISSRASVVSAVAAWVAIAKYGPM
jgi:hypothetical protein